MHNIDTTQTTANAPVVTPHITNTEVPIVVFVGPPASGKSMILVRLAKYLRDNGYTVKPDTSFLSTQNYQDSCEFFKQCLATNVALPGTVTFLLVSVFKNGREIAKMLEAPGEDFFKTPADCAENTRPIKPYLNAIMTSKNRKSYVILLDLDSKVSFRQNNELRDAYSQRFLEFINPQIDKTRDRKVLLYNKIDLSGFGDIHLCTDIEGARSDAKRNYPELFNSEKMHIKYFGGLLTFENFVFKTFCVGTFSEVINDTGGTIEIYYPASDVYPKELWKEITKKW